MIAAGRVSTQARAILRTVLAWIPVPLAAIVPATPEETTCVVLTGKPYISAAPMARVSTTSRVQTPKLAIAPIPNVPTTPAFLASGEFLPLEPAFLFSNELLQNALQHGFPVPVKDSVAKDGAANDWAANDSAAYNGGLLEVIAVREAERLTVTVADNGVGLPEGFDLDATTSLGLQIVRTLVVSELRGRLRIVPRPDGGTEAVVDLPVRNE